MLSRSRSVYVYLLGSVGLATAECPPNALSPRRSWAPHALAGDRVGHEDRLPVVPADGCSPPCAIASESTQWFLSFEYCTFTFESSRAFHQGQKLFLQPISETPGDQRCDGCRRAQDRPDLPTHPLGRCADPDRRRDAWHAGRGDQRDECQDRQPGQASHEAEHIVGQAGDQEDQEEEQQPAAKRSSRSSTSGRTSRATSGGPAKRACISPAPNRSRCPASHIAGRPKSRTDRRRPVRAPGRGSARRSSEG